jgi:hypothetical protein
MNGRCILGTCLWAIRNGARVRLAWSSVGVLVAFLAATAATARAEASARDEGVLQDPRCGELQMLQRTYRLAGSPTTATADLLAASERLAASEGCACHTGGRLGVALFLAEELAARHQARRALGLLEGLDERTLAALANPMYELAWTRTLVGLHAITGDPTRAIEVAERGLSIVRTVGVPPERTAVEEALLRIRAALAHMTLGRLDSAESLLRAVPAVIERIDRKAVQERKNVQSTLDSARFALTLARGEYAAASRLAEQKGEGDPVAEALVAFGSGDGRAADLLESAFDATDSPDHRRQLAMRRVELALRERDAEAASAWLEKASETSLDGGFLELVRLATLSAYAAHCALLEPDEERRLEAARSAYETHRRRVEDLVAGARELRQLDDGIGLFQQADVAFAFSALLQLECAVRPASPQQACLEHVLRLHGVEDEAIAEAARDVHAMLAADEADLLIWIPGRLVTVLMHVSGREPLGAEDRVYFLPLQITATARRIGEARQFLARAVHEPMMAALAYRRVAGLAEDLLPQAARDALLSERLYVSGGAFGVFPIEAFPDGDGGRLGLTKAVCHVASLRRALDGYAEDLAASARSEKARVEGVDGSAPPSLTMLASLRGVPGFERHEFDVAELAPILDLYEPEARRVFLDADVALGAIRPTDSEVLHVVGHRDSEGGEGDGARIAFGPGLALTSEDVRAMAGRLPPTVILSSCGLVAGPARLGTEPLAATIPGAFLQAGSRTVAAAITDVRVEDHLAAMAVAYRELVEGRDLASALRAARAAAANRIDLLLMQVHGIGRRVAR